jgi:phage terminase large subunit-like protein
MKPVDPRALQARLADIREASRLLEGPSLADRISRLGPEARQRIYAQISPYDAARLQYECDFWLRPKQRPPPPEDMDIIDVILWLAGRGFGKSHAGSSLIKRRVEGGAKELGLIGETWGEIRRWMIGGTESGKPRPGKSGLLDICPPWMDVVWKDKDKELHFRAHGAIAYASTAEKPELRGPSLDTAWCDEIIKWKYPEVLWRNLGLTMRGQTDTGLQPLIAVTTTPRPMALLKGIIMSPATRVVMGRLTENTANPPGYVERNLRALGGTRLGKQEIGGELLGDNPDALFDQTTIDLYRVLEQPENGLDKIVVAVDPAASKHRKSDDTGIVVAGVGPAPPEGRLQSMDHLYVLADATGRYSPEEWGRRSVDLLDDWNADAFVVERNTVGDLAASNIRAAWRVKHGRRPLPPIIEVLAEGSKDTRAAPVSSLYEQGRVHHVGRHNSRVLPNGERTGGLEDEMTEWDPSTTKSPNGLDALVHGAFALLPELSEDVAAPPDMDDFEAAQEGFGLQSDWMKNDVL